MATFYGTLTGNRGEGTRCGSKRTGITTVAASWNGCIRVNVYWHEQAQRPYYVVSEEPWHGAGTYREIAKGFFGENQDAAAQPGNQP